MQTTYLQYRTRGDSSPQGKPRVYFCCHPEDFRRFFQQIADEILELQNCAVYYYLPDTEIPPEERELDLGQMNLMVVPVTSRLLYHDNQAMADVAFALERHIPVLPLMQEEHLEETYNQKFNGLHFLNKNDPDPTALSYQEKLKKYLESVLIGDELAQQIREAFDAYIFLSYRKKDRKYAQELMRLIHQNDFCQDIAIWYDEFLTPGEEFSKAIEKALEKSRLFTLVVTPSLLEPGNYVMTTEFPMARDSGKPILPAQMSAVDSQKLEDKYRDIPPCADAKNAALLRQLLLDTLETVAKRQHDGDPKHDFFIGLAYLGGVDVETDYARALELITGAAEAGLPEAIKKLVTMYQTGEGVTRDYYTAISWQEKLVARYQALFDEQHSEEGYRRLRNAIWDLGDNRAAVGNLIGAEEAYRQMNALAQAQAEIFDVRRDISVSCNMRGDIAATRGKLDEALAWYRQSLELAEALAAETETADARRVLSISYGKLGDIATAHGKLDEAYVWYRQSLDIAEVVAAETGVVQAQRDLSICYDKLGEIATARGKLDEALAWYRQSLDIAKAVATETYTVQAQRDLFICCTKLGDIATAHGKLDEALAWYQQSLDIAEAAAAETGTVQAQRDLSISYSKLGDIATARGKLEEASERYRQSIDIFKALAAETGTVEAQRDLSICCTKLGDIAKTRGKLDEAYEWYRLSLELRRALVLETGTLEARSDLSVSYDRLGDIANARRKFGEAAEWYQQSVDIFKALATETGTVEARRDLSVSCLKLGDVAKAHGNLEEAAEWYHQSLELGEALAAETSTVEAQRDLSVIYDRLGDIAKAHGNLDEAAEWYHRSLELAEALATKTGTVEAQRNLSVSYSKLGNIAEIRGTFGEAAEWYRQSLELRKALAKESGTAESLDDLAVSYFMLGMLNGIDQRLLQRAYDIYTLLVQNYPDVTHYQKRLVILEELLKE